MSFPFGYNVITLAVLAMHTTVAVLIQTRRFYHTNVCLEYEPHWNLAPGYVHRASIRSTGIEPMAIIFKSEIRT